MVTRIFITNLLFCLLIGCRSQQNYKYKYDETEITYRNKLKYNGQINLKGFYYTKNKQGGFGIYMFFKDGYVCNFGTLSLDSISIEIDRIRHIPYFWGVYIIEDDNIMIQYVNSNAGIFEKFRIYEETGLVLNDTTIHMMYKKYPRDSYYVIERNKRYHFMKLDTMPSSENILMIPPSNTK